MDILLNLKNPIFRNYRTLCLVLEYRIRELFSLLVFATNLLKTKILNSTSGKTFEQVRRRKINYGQCQNFLLFSCLDLDLFISQVTSFQVVTLSDLESNYISRKPSILYSTIFPFDAIKKLFSASLGLNEPNRYGNIQFIIHYFHISCK